MFFAIDTVMAIGGLSTVQKKIDDGEVSVDGWFWPLSYVNIVIWIVITLNHLLLARFSHQLGKTQMSGHRHLGSDDVI